MIERRTLLLVSVLLITIAVAASAYSIGRFATVSEERATITTTITTTATATTTAVVTTTAAVTTETEVKTSTVMTTSTTTVLGEQPLALHITTNNSSSSSSAVLRGRLLMNGTVLAVFSIDKPVYHLGEIVHIRATVTNLSPESITLSRFLNHLSVRDSSTEDMVWLHPEDDFAGYFGPPTSDGLPFSLAPGETKLLGRWASADWNMTGLHVTLNAEGRLIPPGVAYNPGLVPAGHYIAAWNIDISSSSQPRYERIEEKIPFEITNQ